MHSREGGSQIGAPSKPIPILYGLRGEALAQWTTRVTAGGERSGAPLLADAFDALCDQLEAAVASGAAGHDGDSVRYLLPHGCAAVDIVYELQLLRPALFTVLRGAGLQPVQDDIDLIEATIDGWIRALVADGPGAQTGISSACIAGFAHDLRNPLNVASASAQLIVLKSADPNLANLAMRVVRKIADADAMIQMLHDAALSGADDALTLELSSFDIMALIEEVCADLPLLGQPVHVIGERIEGHWCRKTMKRALENLIGRARKHGKRAAPITVRAAREGDRLGLSVNNAGAVISGAAMAQLFEAPRHADEIALKGWNLGLPYVRKVAQSHGGAVSVDSAAEAGTTFTLWLPVDARTHARTHAHGHAGA